MDTLQLGRDEIRQLIEHINAASSDLLRVDVYHGTSMKSQSFSTSVEISGQPIRHFLKKIDSGFGYVPNYGFSIVIGRSIIPPAGFHASGRMGSHSYVDCDRNEKLPNNKPFCMLLHRKDGSSLACLSMDGERPAMLDDFFSFNDGEHDGAKFHPFTIEGDADFIAETKTEFYVDFRVFFAGEGFHSIRGDLSRAGRKDIETLVYALVEAFSTNIKIYQALKPQYQPREYCAVEERLHKQFMRAIERALKDYGIKFEREYGWKKDIRGFVSVARDYGLVVATKMYAEHLLDKLNQVFKGGKP